MQERRAAPWGTKSGIKKGAQGAHKASSWKFGLYPFRRRRQIYDKNITQKSVPKFKSYQLVGERGKAVKRREQHAAAATHSHGAMLPLRK
jgi:hypothetical protein